MDSVILWTRTLLHGQISPGQVVRRDGAGRWLGPLLTYLTMWTLGHRRNILIYLTMTLLTRRRDTALNEETHLSFTLSTNYSPRTYGPQTKDYTIESLFTPLFSFLLCCFLASPYGWVSSGDWSPCRSVEISWSVSESEQRESACWVYNGTRPSSPPVTHIMGRHHRAQHR